MKPLIIIFSLAILTSACEDPFESGSEGVPQSYVNNSLLLFKGEVIEQTSATLNSTGVWKISVKNENNAIVNFYWRKSIGNLYKVEGISGPFDYNLKPPFDVINFAAARFLATNNFQLGNIISWSFDPSLKENMKWFYTFNGDGSTPKIVLDAGSGAVIR